MWRNLDTLAFNSFSLLGFFFVKFLFQKKVFANLDPIRLKATADRPLITFPSCNNYFLRFSKFSQFFNSLPN